MLAGEVRREVPSGHRPLHKLRTEPAALVQEVSRASCHPARITPPKHATMHDLKGKIALVIGLGQSGDEGWVSVQPAPFFSLVKELLSSAGTAPSSPHREPNERLSKKVVCAMSKSLKRPNRDR